MKVWVQVLATLIKSQIYKISKERRSATLRFLVTIFRHPGPTHGATEDVTAFKVAQVIITATDAETHGPLLESHHR